MDKPSSSFSWHVYDLDLNRAYHDMKALVDQGEFEFKRNQNLSSKEYLENMRLTVETYCKFNGLDPEPFLNNSSTPLIANSTGSAYEFHLAYCLFSFDINLIDFFLDYQKMKVSDNSNFVQRVEFLVYRIVKLNCAFQLNNRLIKITSWVKEEKSKISARPPQPLLVVPSQATDVSSIIKKLYSKGIEIQTKPSLYLDKGEDGMRDALLYGLTGHFPDVIGVAEGKNKFGKTDILLVYSDGRNAFIGECKLWLGPKLFGKGINQLIERYLTWHDKRAAIIIFVENADFTIILEKIQAAISKHKLHVKTLKSPDDSWFSHLFRSKDDKTRELQLEFMIFHCPKKLAAKKKSRRAKPKSKHQSRRQLKKR